MRTNQRILIVLTCIFGIVLTTNTDDGLDVINGVNVEEDNGGWKLVGETPVEDNLRCNIERVDGQTLTQEQFIHEYAFTKPVIITNIDNSRFQKATQRIQMLQNWSDAPVVLNSANTFSYRRVESTFGDYVNTHLGPQDLKKLGNETLYLFGDINTDYWAPLLNIYNKPKWSLPGHEAALSFGIAGQKTGFAEVIFGSKRWFLTPHEERPKFNPDNSTMDWYLNEYPKLTEKELPLECLMKPNELIYFPDKWYHATLNMETSVFISTFLSPVIGKKKHKKQEL